MIRDRTKADSAIDENEVVDINNNKKMQSKNKSEQAPSLVIYKKIRIDLFKIFEFFLISIIMLVAVTAIYNISARETLSKSIEAKIHTLNSEFVSSNKQVLSGNILPDGINNLPEQVAEIAKLEKLSSEIQALKAYGGNSFSNLGTIKSTFIFSEKTSENSNGYYGYFGTLEYFFAQLPMLSSDMLLALALLSCGALGSVIASIKSNSSVNLSKFTIGFTTGFITYLAIKGGQFVFLLQVPGASAVLNPYTASFVGLLSGMFSERFHLVLGSFMDAATEKLKNSKSDSNKT